jgi:hypothetical protein
MSESDLEARLQALLLRYQQWLGRVLPNQDRDIFARNCESLIRSTGGMLGLEEAIRMEENTLTFYEDLELKEADTPLVRSTGQGQP